MNPIIFSRIRKAFGEESLEISEDPILDCGNMGSARRDAPVLHV